MKDMGPNDRHDLHECARFAQALDCNDPFFLRLCSILGPSSRNGCGRPALRRSGWPTCGTGPLPARPGLTASCPMGHALRRHGHGVQQDLLQLLDARKGRRVPFQGA